MESYRTNIDSLLGTSSTKVASDDKDSSELYSYVSDYSSTTELVQAIADLGEEMSEEGTVLLKNENSALPLTEEETQKISLLGFSSYYPVMGGDMGSSLTGNEGTYLPGEDGVDSYQNLNQTDPLGLSDDERDLIAAAVATKESNGGKVIVLLNNASAMEIEEIAENDGVDAILEIGLPGGYGFYGVADILSGDANPSGHLSDTYAVVNANAPSAQNFGNYTWTNANSDYSINSAQVEAEGIYVGYKYYETRYMDSVLGQGNASAAVGSTDGVEWSYDNEVTYSFGYGLSCTTFEQTLDSLEVDLENQTVTVTNTGDVAGKDVVQLYVSTPYTAYDKANGIETAGVQLLDYETAAALAAGESETVTVTVTITADVQYMASWDSTSDNAAGTTGCYILDAGTSGQRRP